MKRADGLERIVFSECGNVIFTYDAARLAYTRGIVQYFIPRFLSTTVSDNRVSFTELLNEIADNDMRNAAIADDIRKAYADGRSILVITRRIEQNNSIGKHLASLCVPNFILKSTMKQREVAAILQKVCTPEHPVLIATDKLLGEGVDIPMLDTLVLASPFMQEGAIQQYAGRIARAADGKKDTLIYDYADYLIPQLSCMYLRRLSAYKKLGYVSLLDTKQPRIQMLYDNVSFVDTFLSDISKASVYKGYKRDKIEMRGDRAEMSDFPLYLNTVAGGLDCRNQAIGGFSFVVKIYALPVVKIIGQFLYLLGRYGFDAQIGYCF